MINDKVHYIWVGNLSNEKNQVACALGPKSLATLDQNAEIIVWVQEDELYNAKTLFNQYGNIKVNSIDSMFKKTNHLEDDLKKTFLEFYYDHNMPNVAKKDLLAQIILNEFGGYFFDTSTQFTDKPSLPKLQGDEFKLELERDHFNEPHAHVWIAPDVWALAFPANHKLLKIALQNSSNTINESRTFLGNMFCDSINQALDTTFNNNGFKNQTFPSPTTEQIKKLREVCWVRDILDSDAGPNHHIAELHLYKFNLGLWRNFTNPKTFLENKKSTYDFLLLALPPRAQFLVHLDDCKKKLEQAPENTILFHSSINALNTLIKIVEEEKIDVNTILSEKYTYDQIIKAIDIQLKKGSLEALIHNSSCKNKLTTLLDDIIENIDLNLQKETEITDKLDNKVIESGENTELNKITDTPEVLPISFLPGIPNTTSADLDKAAPNPVNPSKRCFFNSFRSPILPIVGSLVMTASVILGGLAVAGLLSTAFFTAGFAVPLLGIAISLLVIGSNLWIAHSLSQILMQDGSNFLSI